MAAVLLCMPFYPLMAVGFLPMLGLFGVGRCCCGGTCTIFTDDYSTDRTGTDYTTSAGTWAVSGGVLTCTTASALITANTAVTAGLTGIYVRASITCATTSDIARLIIGYSNDSNYWFCEAAPGAVNGTIKIYQRSGGVNTQIGSTLTFTSFTTVRTADVCMSYLNGTVNVVGTVLTTTKSTLTEPGTITAAGSKVGMGTGAGTSSVTFDSFELQKHNVDDSTCPNCVACNGCNPDLIPAEMQVTFSGIANGGTCLGCAGHNATFVLSSGTCNCVNSGNVLPPAECPQNINECRWFYSGALGADVCPAPFTSSETICIVLGSTTGGLFATVYHNSNLAPDWTARQSGGFADSSGHNQCYLLNGTAIGGTPTTVHCDFSGASATVTAL